MQTVKCSKFVKRQTPESGHSHYMGKWSELEEYAEVMLSSGQYRIGYRDGVVLIDYPPYVAKYFRSAIVDLTEETKLKSCYASRRDGEAAFIRVSAKAKKQVAKHASLVLYRKDVLDEGNERETDADWEIVCIKARTSDEEEPMDPYTMARNFLKMDGGTKGDFTAEQFAKSIVYWNQHCMTVGKPDWYKKIANWFRGG
jgi:hypothetical protein